MTFKVGDRVIREDTLEQGVVVGVNLNAEYVHVHYDWYIEENGAYDEDDWHSVRVDSLELVNPKPILKGIAKFIKRVERDYYDETT
jgi:hypothetical protein